MERELAVRLRLITTDYLTKIVDGYEKTIAGQFTWKILLPGTSHFPRCGVVLLAEGLNDFVCQLKKGLEKV